MDEEYGKISMGPGDESSDEGDGEAASQDEEDEHHLKMCHCSGCHFGQHETNEQCMGDPFFDWEDLDDAYKKQRHEALALKVKELVAEMRWMRSKAFWIWKKTHEKEQRMNMKHMKRIRKSGTTMSTYFNWDELDKAEEELEMSHKEMQRMKESSAPMSSYFDWDELSKAEEHEQEKVDKRMKDKIKTISKALAKTTGSIDLKASSYQKAELKEQRWMKKISMEAVRKMKNQKLHEAWG